MLGLLRLLVGLLILLGIGAGGFWLLTLPRGLSAEASAELGDGDPVRGETWFWAGGCASCHAKPDAEGDARLRLGGGLALETDFGTFHAPNVSMHPADGIGGWSLEDFAAAMLAGVSPDGRHYYPAFPYASYRRMQPEDVADLWAFWQTLPEVEGTPPPHALSLPYSIRRGVGLWKLAALREAPVVAVDASDPALVRGRYLVEAAGHCGECHTPRDSFGIPDRERWLSGGADPEGDGTIPNITPGTGGIGSWSADDIAYFLESGFTPDFDSVGGSMASVQRSLENLPSEDLAAIAAYLKAVPPQPSAE
jgi:mono/diheme cytochrome c family protein